MNSTEEITQQENRRIAMESALRIAPLNYTNTSFNINELLKNAKLIEEYLNNKQP